MSLFLLFFTTGLTVGFGHCTGMCGPIAVSLSLNMKGGRIWPAHLMYHSGRILTYSVLGAIMGTTGSFTRVIEPLLGLQKAVLIATGCLIVIMGLAMTGWIPKLGFLYADPGFGGFMITRFQKYMRTRKSIACFPLGIFLGCLPCGPVYVALVAAARAGMEATTPLAAMLIGTGIMLCFGMGTVPALLLVGGMSNLKWIRNRKAIHMAGAVLVMFAGVYFVVRGLK